MMNDEIGRDERVLARVRKELELARRIPEPVLILNSSCLTAIPEVVLNDGHCRKHLKELCLKNNSIQSLPNTLSNLRALRKLYLPTNELEQLPEVLAHLPSLAFLDVSNNSISSISPAIATMNVLKDLNLSNNQLAHLPDEIWKVPHLQTLNAQGNQLETLSSKIIHCRSLSKLILDCNELSYLPTQITKLPNLKYLSLAGNTLQALPNDFSGTTLQTVLVDMNLDLPCIPVSLAPLSWWGTLGVEGCPSRVKRENLSFLKPLHTCEHVPPLMELTARHLHRLLKKTLQGSISLWQPEKLCSLLGLPQGLTSWLLPSGRCFNKHQCHNIYFRHHYTMLVSGIFYKKIDPHGVCKPNDLALSIDLCSSQCAKSYFSA